ncbi:TonB-dependent receptor domain-containing protein [Marinomonas gallaica]|uniref:TonB-dependent receptor domain-containing protein n=1 Tax=Marinomonas gallaica TaxID=1806667 RepID=UPI003CE49F14
MHQELVPYRGIPIATNAPNPGFPAFRENTTKTLGLYLQDMITVGDWLFTGNVRQDRMESTSFNVCSILC